MTVDILLSIYDSHIGDLFIKSLTAELAKHPHLLELTPKRVKEDPPEILFRSRLKGYFIAPNLCRLWVLQVLRSARQRGEYFVMWKDPDTGNEHDGTLLFAHYFTITYLSLHRPAMSVLFHADGSLRSTSVHVNKLRDYIWGHRRALARRCHDMSKQMYLNKKYTPEVWQPLHNWLYESPTCVQLRKGRLLSFNKTDDDLHTIIAKCLWSLARAANVPWGRNALKPHGYSVVPIAEKVSMSE